MAVDFHPPLEVRNEWVLCDDPSGIPQGWGGAGWGGASPTAVSSCPPPPTAAQDYRPQPVLAGYLYVPAIAMGLVVKDDAPAIDQPLRSLSWRRGHPFI